MEFVQLSDGTIVRLKAVSWLGPIDDDDEAVLIVDGVSLSINAQDRARLREALEAYLGII